MKTKNEYEKNTLANRVLVIAYLSAVLGLTGCQQEGTAEKAGQKIDRAAENAQQKIEQATEKTAQKIEAAKESLDQKAEKVKETIDESTDASKGALENAEKKIEGAKESVIDKAQSAGEYIDDSVITTKVKAAILNDPILNASHIEVTTVNGVVKLSGTVDSEQAIGRAMEVASSQKNVKSVQTDLIVNATSPR